MDYWGPRVVWLLNRSKGQVWGGAKEGGETEDACANAWDKGLDCWLRAGRNMNHQKSSGQNDNKVTNNKVSPRNSRRNRKNQKNRGNRNRNQNHYKGNSGGNGHVTGNYKRPGTGIAVGGQGSNVTQTANEVVMGGNESEDEFYLSESEEDI
jgi:hypothetical protein